MPGTKGVIIALLVIIAIYLLLWPKSASTSVPARPPSPEGVPIYRQRLIAVGDLHGGRLTSWVELTSKI